MTTAHRIRLHLGIVAALALGQVALTSTAACHPTARSLAPTLGEIVSRVDVPRLLECAAMAGAERARCLGASAATTALDLAVDKAVDAAERARDALADKGGAGSELTPADSVLLSDELDAALDELARQIAATH